MNQLLAVLALLPGIAPAQDPGITRCVNPGDAPDSPAVDGEWSYTDDEADQDRIAAAGFDTVRLPVRFSRWWDGAGLDLVFQARVPAVSGRIRHLPCDRRRIAAAMAEGPWPVGRSVRGRLVRGRLVWLVSGLQL